jgi:outer membrane protein assembly factor BamD
MKGSAMPRLIAILTLGFLVLGCAALKERFSRKTPDKPPEVLAEEGIKQLRKKKYIDAVDTFTKIKDRYPYSEQALLAQIKLADALYYDKKYEEALQAYKEFEKLHPTNKAIPYVIYQQGLCYYRQRSTIDRDQAFTRKALDEFLRLEKKFPQSEYASRAGKYIARCRQDLAEHEFYVASFYLRTRRFSSALDRFQALAQEYPTFKPGEVKRGIEECQQALAAPEKTQGFISRIFDAQW